MTSPTDIAKDAVSAALQKISDEKLSEDALARALITEAVVIFRKSRSVGDIASELEFIAEHLEEGEEFNFMRP